MFTLVERLRNAQSNYGWMAACERNHCEHVTAFYRRRYLAAYMPGASSGVGNSNGFGYDG